MSTIQEQLTKTYNELVKALEITQNQIGLTEYDRDVQKLLKETGLFDHCISIKTQWGNKPAKRNPGSTPAL